MKERRENLREIQRLRMDEEFRQLEESCPHVTVFGFCKFSRYGCRDRFVRVKKVPTHSSSQ